LSRPLSILLVEDSPSDAGLLLRELKKHGFEPSATRVESGPALERALLDGKWDVVVSDWTMPQFSGLAALRMVRSKKPEIPFLVVSGTIGEDTAVEALQAGAADYLVKGKLGRLGRAIERELSHRVSRDAQRQAEAALKSTEEQLRQAQKMEAVGRLAGGIAHDFNNVLSVILSCAELILSDLRHDDPMRSEVEEIEKAGKRAAGLTRQLLMFSRQQVVEPKVLDLNGVLRAMDKMLRSILGADIDFVYMPFEPLGRVKVDPSSIEQVVMNLVVNARHAMPKGGQLTIETANVTLDEAYAREHLGTHPGPHVMIAVTDSGVGIAKDVIGRIFEPFFTTKAPGIGTGLGLSTVIGIVQQSAGSIWVYSEVGRGTTFKVYLPRVDNGVEPAQVLEPAAKGKGSETILLVEDDDQVRTVTRDILRRGGYEVLEARNAGEAILLAEKHPEVIHLLLTDVVMPQMSGPELAKRLGGARPDMAVLCMSGYTDDSIVRHGVLEASLAFLQKPITRAALITKVREVLDTKNRGKL
jgi:two-component system cell cycle sensor histidine kinase/response regulator CckA